MKSNYTKFVEIILTACNKWKNTIKQYLLYPGKNSVWLLRQCQPTWLLMMWPRRWGSFFHIFQYETVFSLREERDADVSHFL